MNFLRGYVVLLVVLFGLLNASQGERTCAQTHPYVGLAGQLSTLAHSVGGNVTILDDCHFKVEGFTYDGKAPAAYWWGSEGSDQNQLEEGMKLNNDRLVNAVNGDTMTVELNDGTTWDDVKTLAIWCMVAHADFGDLDLAKLSSEKSGSSPGSGSASGAGGCTKAHPYVGLSGNLTGLEHDVAGTITVLDDCSFMVENFTYDGAAPAAYWWGSAGPKQNQLEGGIEVNGTRLASQANGDMFTVTLNDGVTWDMISTLAVWCEQFNANFGFLDFSTVAGSKPDAGIGSGACTKAHPYVGLTGDLAELEHDVGGTITVLDDCSFMVEGFTYDGKAPAAYWWGSAGSEQDQLEAGIEVNGTRLTAPANGDMFTVTLNKGVTWDAISTLAVWCEQFNANFGFLELSTLAGAMPVAGAPGSAPESYMEVPMNCIEIIPSFYNLYYMVEDDNVTLMFEGRISDGMWMGFGFTAPTAKDVLMVGSDVVIVGSIDEACFAVDYYLGDYAMCNQDTLDDGVCPDTGFANSSRANNVVLESCEWEDGILRVMATRPLKASDKWDNVWPTEKTRPAVWATGPILETATVQRPVILFHQGKLPGGTGKERLYASPGFKVNLGTTGSTCTPLKGGEIEIVNKTLIPPEVLAPEYSVFNVTLGEDANYPNPPAWGVSYHINGYETPVLTVVRGETYTFIISSGATHPFYITTSILGGGPGEGDPQTVFAGGEDSHGTPEEPYTLEWTVQRDVPDLVYYMCYTHLKLGWRIMVIDMDDAMDFPVTG